MSQAKVITVGFREYQKLTIAVTSEKPAANAPAVFDRLPEGHADLISVKNTGAKDCVIVVNKYINDPLTVKAGTTVDFPLKAYKIYAYCPTAADTTTLEIIGYME